MKAENDGAFPKRWVDDGADPVLIGSQCSMCEEIYFPKKETNYCPQCDSEGLSQINLTREGSIQAFTIVYQQSAGGFYKGPVPYCYGIVCLPEGVDIYTLFTDCKWEQMKFGQKAKLRIEKLYEQDGQDILTFKFEPIF